MKSEPLLIGVDGGATKVEAHAVECSDWADLAAASFELGAAGTVRTYQRLPEFAPLPADEQVAQRKAGSIRLTPDERAHGALWVEAACAAIDEVSSADRGRKLLVGIGMPGLKTADGRGICVINNGPRIPDYLDQLEQGLRTAGLELVSPVATLGSDADYCGLGEQHAATGLFRDVDTAYYIGGGTGLADALKLRGRLLPFDDAKGWILKSWQMHSAIGPTFEQLVSAKAINERYAALTSATSYPEEDAAQGHPIAVALLDITAMILAELTFERLDTISNGRGHAPHRGDAYQRLDDSHDYRSLFLDRVVIGQRLGAIYADDRVRPAFGAKVDQYLAALITASGTPEMAAHYLDHGQLKPRFVCPSELRAAPALGAAIAAAHAWTRQ